jgi:DNA-directed RNA polymerase subunit E'/Rpb7
MDNIEIMDHNQDFNDIGLNINNTMMEIEEANIDFPMIGGDNITLKEKNKTMPMLKKKIQKSTEIYTPAIMSKTIMLPFRLYDKNIYTTLLKHIKMKLEGYCLKEGYVKPDSVEIIEYSPGSIMGENVKFQVSLQCMVCHPVEGMIIDCSVKNVTKAGIRAEISKYEKSPLVIFVARDHHYDNVEFNNIKEDDIIQVKIIGMRFELNDTYVSVIAELI